MTTIQHVEANGLRFAYLEEGKGPLVLLLHGFPDTAYSWDRVRPALGAAGYRAVSPFSRGYYPTAVPADGAYDIETLGQDALALISALGEEQAVVVGHDWGASAAYAAAILGPARVRALVTVSIPHPGAMLLLPRVLWGARHLFALRLPGAEARVRADDFAYVDELVRRWSPSWQVPAGETAAVKEVFRRPEYLSAALGYYRDLRVPPPAALRKPITVPTATFASMDDGILRLSDYERVGRLFRDRYEIIAMSGGHFLHREHPERFIHELLRVLRGAPAPQPR